MQIAHHAPIAHTVRWARNRLSVIGFSAPGWQVQVRKDRRTNRFIAEAVGSQTVLFLGEAKLQRDAKAIAQEWSATRWLDYAEEFNTRQESHFHAPESAKARLDRWELNVSKGHREQALLGAWTEAEEEDFARAHA